MALEGGRTREACERVAQRRATQSDYLAEETRCPRHQPRISGRVGFAARGWGHCSCRGVSRVDQTCVDGAPSHKILPEEVSAERREAWDSEPRSCGRIRNTDQHSELLSVQGLAQTAFLKDAVEADRCQLLVPTGHGSEY